MKWPAEAVWEAVEPTLPGFSVEILPQLDSTNTELMRRARAGMHDPTLLVAERQTAGRGRLGRTWQSAQDAAEAMPLTFSLGLDVHRHDWSGLSLVVGVTVALALRQALPTDVAQHLGLKWPNDLWWQGQKLCGILIETSGTQLPRYAVIGVGVNISAPAEPSDGGFSVPPIGLQQLDPQSPTPWDAGRALGLIAPALVGAVQRFDREGFAPFKPLFESVDLLRDQAVTLTQHAQGMSEGVARGVDAQGALCVDTLAGPVVVNSGEVSVRPRKELM